MMFCTHGGIIDPPSELDWDELENYGADSEVGRFLVNRDGACDYGDVSDPTAIEAYKVFARENLEREHQGRGARTFKQLRGKLHGVDQKLAS